MPRIDLRDFVPKHTLFFTVPKIDGTEEEWQVPPFDNETEHAYWQWQRDLLEKRKREQQAALGIVEGKDEEVEIEENTQAEVFAPLLVCVVKKPQLEVETLLRDYHPAVLTMVANAVINFFLKGELPPEFQTEENEK